MSEVTDDVDLGNLFTYHAPGPDQIDRYQRLRGEGYMLAESIHTLCPPSPERSVAIQKVREAIMWANAAIACNEEVVEHDDVNFRSAKSGRFVSEDEAKANPDTTVREEG